MTHRSTASRNGDIQCRDCAITGWTYVTHGVSTCAYFVISSPNCSKNVSDTSQVTGRICYGFHKLQINAFISICYITGVHQLTFYRRMLFPKQTTLYGGRTVPPNVQKADHRLTTPTNIMQCRTIM